MCHLFYHLLTLGLLYLLVDVSVLGEMSAADGDKYHAAIPKDDSCNANLTRPSTSHKHVIVLVHGIMGNRMELGYVKESLEREFRLLAPLADDHASCSLPSIDFVVHTSYANENNTLDGVEAGGRRLAAEINEILHNESKEGPVALSILGNSLGGLYARFSLPYIDWAIATTDTTESAVLPNIFVTTATPHMGIRDMTFLSLPRRLQSIGARSLKQSGQDLFRFNDVIHRLCLDPEFLEPLSRFSKRIAFSNAFWTDAPVVTSTAAFLAQQSSSLHHLVETSFGDRHPYKDAGLHVHAPYPSIRLETHPYSHDNNKCDEDPINFDPDETGSDHHIKYAECLDSLGWTKIFVDARSHIPALWNRGKRRNDLEQLATEKSSYTSAELHDRLSAFDWNTLPFAHSFMVASSKNSIYKWFYSGGQALVDRIARELAHEILGGVNGEA